MNRRDRRIHWTLLTFRNGSLIEKNVLDTSQNERWIIAHSEGDGGREHPGAVQVLFRVSAGWYQRHSQAPKECSQLLHSDYRLLCPSSVDSDTAAIRAREPYTRTVSTMGYGQAGLSLGSVGQSLARSESLNSYGRLHINR